MAFQVGEFRKNFPQLERRQGPLPLIYFDNGASSLKHSAVTDRINSYNRFESSNVHRGAHLVSRTGTEAYEVARQRLQEFVNAPEVDSMIFTRGTTEGINLVASILENEVEACDEILISPFEHHSNIVPWQRLCEKRGCQLKVIPFDSERGVTEQGFRSALTEKTKVLAIIQYSNSFGNRLPVEKFVDIAKNEGVITLVDSAQAVLTERIDVQKMGCDFLVFSAHKMYGPYGVGGLYGRKELLDRLPPYQTGGSMIDRVTFEKTTYASVPQKYEAGTPNVSGAIGLSSAVKVLLAMDWSEQHKHVMTLRNRLMQGLGKFDSVEVYNFLSDDYTGVVSFNVKGSHPSDVGTLLDKYGFAVRAGHHCTQPLMSLLGVAGTVRASLAPYNTIEEVDAFLQAMHKVQEFF